MANQHDQNGMRSNHQSDQRDNELHGRSPSSSGSHYQQGQGAEFGDDDRSRGRADYPRGGGYGRQQGEGRWAGGAQDNDRQSYRDDPFPPPVYADERGRGQRGYEQDQQGAFSHQRHGPSGQSPGRSQADSGYYGQGGGYAQSSYGHRGSYNQRGPEHRDFGQGGFGQGGSGPGSSAQENAMQGLSYYDQDYDSPYRGSYGGGGYGEDHRPGPESGRYGQQQFGRGGRGMPEAGHAGHRRSGYERRDDGPSEAAYFGDSDHGNWARAYGGEGRSGSSAMGYTARGQGGSGYAEQSGGAGNRSGGSYRGMGPRGYKRSDERLCEDINERLTDDDHIDASDISIDVKDGVVTLSGEVDQRRLKHRIEDMVEACHGVQDIRNEIRVKRGGSDRSGGRSGSSESAGTASGGTPAASGFSGSGSSAGGSSGSGLSSESAASAGSNASGGASQSSVSSGQRNGNEDASRTDQSGASAASRKK